MNVHIHNSDNDPLEVAYRQMLAETMKPCSELSLGERVAKRVEDRRTQRELEELGIHTPSPDVDKVCTGNPEIASAEPSEGAA